MRNPALPGIALFYSTVAFLLAVTVVVVRTTSFLGASAQAFSNACENLALIALALGVWVRRN